MIQDTSVYLFAYRERMRNNRGTEFQSSSST